VSPDLPKGCERSKVRVQASMLLIKAYALFAGKEQQPPMKTASHFGEAVLRLNLLESMVPGGGVEPP
jgi:hypothetical protein